MLKTLIVVMSAATLVASVHAAEPISIDLNAAVAGVCRPTFVKDGKAGPSGTGFILHAPVFTPRDVLVSAHHLFQMATANSRGIPWQDVSRRITSATCLSFDGAKTWSASKAVAIPGVYAFWRTPGGVKDVAILPVAAGPPTTLELSPTPVKPGDIVWVLAQVEHPRPTDTFVHRARVVPSDGFLTFMYDGPPFDTSNISGAPIVNSDGKVVGVNVGAGKSPTGVQFGVGDDLATLQSALLAARPPS